MNRPLHPAAHVAGHRDHDHRKVQALLTVEQIMTPRSQFLCCAANDPAGRAFDGIPDVYDAAPVVNGTRDDPDAEVIGLIWRSEVAGAGPAKSVLSLTNDRPVTEALKPDAAMLDYARNAVADRVALVAGRGAVLGLVTVYDLERLPVRLSLFQHVLDLEERLGEAITGLARDPETWADLVPDRRKEIQDGIARSRRRDHHGSPILGIGFTEKIEIARVLLPRALGKTFDPSSLDRVATFRNDIAHGLPFKRVEDVPRRVRQIDGLLQVLKSPRLRPHAGE